MVRSERRTCLRTSHQITLLNNDRDRVALHGRRLREASKLHVVVDHGTKVNVHKRFNRWRQVLALHRHLNVLVLVEVEARGCLREELLLDARIARQKPVGTVATHHLLAAQETAAATRPVLPLASATGRNATLFAAKEAAAAAA